MIKTILTLILLFPLLSQSKDLEPGKSITRKAKIYAIGKTDDPALFNQITIYKTAGDQTESLTTITDLSGAVVLTELTKSKGIKVSLQVVEQFQTGFHYETEVKGDQIFFRSRKIAEPENKNKESVEKLSELFCIGPIIEVYLAEHWEALMAFRTVTVDFGVPDLSKTVSFNFKFQELTPYKGRDVARITMKGSSFVIRMAVDPIIMELDPKTKRYVHYLGRTPLFIEKNKKLEPLKAEIIFE